MQSPESPIGFGTWPLGGRAYGPVVEAQAVAAIERAVELGVKLFDTANIYGDGRAEELLGRTLPSGDDFLIVSKAGYADEAGSRQDFSASHLRRSVEGSLGRLRRDSLEVLLLHSPPEEVLREGRACEVLDELREEGVARRVGVSLRTLDSFDAALAWDGCSVVELILNLLDQRAIDAGLVERASRAGVELIARVPLCFGFLSGRHSLGATFSEGDQRNRWPRRQLDLWIEGAERFSCLVNEKRSMTQAALAFCVGTPGVTYAIPGMKTPAQVEHNVAAGSPECRLTTEEMAEARMIWDSLRHITP